MKKDVLNVYQFEQYVLTRCERHSFHECLRCEAFPTKYVETKMLNKVWGAC